MVDFVVNAIVFVIVVVFVAVQLQVKSLSFKKLVTLEIRARQISGLRSAGCGNVGSLNRISSLLLSLTRSKLEVLYITVVRS